MSLVHLPASSTSVSSNVCKPNPSRNQNPDPDLNPVSYSVAVPNQNCSRFTIWTGRICLVHLCLVTSLAITLRNKPNPNFSTDSHPDRYYIIEPIPNPNPTNTNHTRCTRNRWMHQMHLTCAHYLLYWFLFNSPNFNSSNPIPNPNPIIGIRQIEIWRIERTPLYLSGCD